MANKFLVVFEDGRTRRIQSIDEDISFNIVSVGPSELPIAETGGHFDFGTKKLTGIGNGVASTDAVSVGQMEDYVAGSVSGFALSEWLNSAQDILGTPPGSPILGSRYLVSGTLTGDFVSHQDEIAQWNGSSWTFTVPEIGSFISIDDETDGVYLYSGFVWSKKYFEGTTASNGLRKIGLDVQVKFEATNPTLEVDGNDALKVKFTDGLATGSSGLTVKLDGGTLAKGVDGIKIADGGVGPAQLSTAVAGAGLTGGGGTELIVGAGAGIRVTDNAVQAEWSVVLSNTSGSTLNPRDVVVISASGIEPASATYTELAIYRIGIVDFEAIANGNNGLVVVQDGARIGGFSGLAAGQIYYVSKTAKQITNDISAYTVNDFVYQVGYAVSSTELIFSPQFIIEL
jgi:hypothetical protein